MWSGSFPRTSRNRSSRCWRRSGRAAAWWSTRRVTGLLTKRPKQHGRELVHFAEAGPFWRESRMKSVRREAFQHISPLRDDVDRHVPRSVEPADQSRRFVIANQNHHEILIRMLTQITGERFV